MAKKAEKARVTETEVGGVERVVADVPLLVERPDVGDGVFTFVAAGDPIPAGLEGFARREADVPEEPSTPTVA